MVQLFRILFPSMQYLSSYLVQNEYVLKYCSVNWQMRTSRGWKFGVLSPQGLL